MEQLKVKDILQGIENLITKDGYSREEILEMPVYIGDDDELNGIHCAWFCEVLSEDNPEDDGDIEMINERAGNIPFKKNAILIS